MFSPDSRLQGKRCLQGPHVADLLEGAPLFSCAVTDCYFLLQGSEHSEGTAASGF